MSVDKPSMLVADDDGKIRNLVVSYLRAEGYEVSTASNGRDAVEAVRRSEPDIVILDVAMPELDGLEALREIRTFSNIYVIMLTARVDETDKLIGLSVGADDYMTKPFSPRELVARVKAVLRRQRSTAGTGSSADDDAVLLRFPHLEIDIRRHEVRIDDSPVQLTALEFALLLAMARQPGRVFSRSQLLEKVWGWDHVGDDRLVDVHIGKLRRALGDDASAPRFIATVRGVGYRFEQEAING